MGKYIVTSYEHPDLDGISSMYAYSEYLNKTGKSSRYYVRENIKTEPHIVCDMFGIELNSVDEIEKMRISYWLIQTILKWCRLSMKIKLLK